MVTKIELDDLIKLSKLFSKEHSELKEQIENTRQKVRDAKDTLTKINKLLSGWTFESEDEDE